LVAAIYDIEYLSMVGGGEGPDDLVQVLAAEDSAHIFDCAEAVQAAVLGAYGHGPCGAAGAVGAVRDISRQLVAQVGTLDYILHNALPRHAGADHQRLADIDAPPPE